jgi:hypothetical protein
LRAKCSLTPCKECVLAKENEEAFQELLKRNFPEEFVLSRIGAPVECEVKVGKRVFTAVRTGSHLCTGCSLEGDSVCHKLSCIDIWRGDKTDVIYIEKK